MTERVASTVPGLPYGETPGRRPNREWVDRFLGSDPGLTRLRLAGQAVVTIAVAMVAEWLFVTVTGALQIEVPTGQAGGAAVAAQHHAVLVIAIMIGSIMGLMASFAASMFPRKRLQLLALILMPVPMVAGLALGLSLASHRTLGLASFVVVLAAGGYLRRFGPWGFFGGQLVFMGDFFGFFLHGVVTAGDIGWLTLEIVVGIGVAIAAHFTLFFPGRRSALRRMRRSFNARSRQVADAARDVIDQPGDPGRSRRLHRLLIRLNETALMVDAQLGDPAALPAGLTATNLHQNLFDSELALTNLARFGERIAHLDVPPRALDLARETFSAVIADDLARVEATGAEMISIMPTSSGPDRTGEIVVHRFADSAVGYAGAVRAARTATSGSVDEAEEFESSVKLSGGWLPGSATVSGDASAAGGIGRRDRVQLPAYARVAIQLAVAVTGAIVLGSLLSERRFYWAVIAAFVTFMGAHHAAEQLRKGMLRVVGTVVGVLLGALIVHLTGANLVASVAVILVALFLGLYFMRVSYAFMVIGITVMVSELYLQLDEFSDSLLLLRLEETAIGAATAALAVLLVVPLRTGKVARTALCQHVEALNEVVQIAVLGLLDPAELVRIRAAVRQLDVAYQSLVAVLKPLRNPLPGTANGPRRRLLQTAAASRNYARNLVSDTSSGHGVPAPLRADFERAGDHLTSALTELASALGDGSIPERTYVRSAAIFDLVATRLSDADATAPTQLALRDLMLLDGAGAVFAELVQMRVADFDSPSAMNGTHPPATAAGSPPESAGGSAGKS